MFKVQLLSAVHATGVGSHWRHGLSWRTRQIALKGGWQGFHNQPLHALHWVPAYTEKTIENKKDGELV